jgi:hypothetical protein
MRLTILGDISGETKVDEVIFALNDTGYRRFFDEQNYGEEVNGICIVLMCRAPYLKFKQRIRFSKKEKVLYMDIMLDYNQFIDVDQSVRNRIVAEKLITEVPQIISKYKFKEFNLPKFEADWKEIIGKII